MPLITDTYKMILIRFDKSSNYSYAHIVIDYNMTKESFINALKTNRLYKKSIGSVSIAQRTPPVFLALCKWINTTSNARCNLTR